MCPVHIAFFRRRSQMKYYPPVNGTTGLGCHCLQARFLRCFFRVKLSFSFSSIHFESVLPFFAKHIKKKNLLKKVEWLLLNQMKIPVVTLCLAPCLNPIFYQEAVVLQKSHDTFTPTLRLCPSRMQISYYLSPPIHTVNIHSFRLELRSQKFRDTTSSHPNG